MRKQNPKNYNPISRTIDHGLFCYLPEIASSEVLKSPSGYQASKCINKHPIGLLLNTFNENFVICERKQRHFGGIRRLQWALKSKKANNGDWIFRESDNCKLHLKQTTFSDVLSITKDINETLEQSQLELRSWTEIVAIANINDSDKFFNGL